MPEQAISAEEFHKRLDWLRSQGDIFQKLLELHQFTGLAKPVQESALKRMRLKRMTDDTGAVWYVDTPPPNAEEGGMPHDGAL